jgi:hypothetical protein
VARQGTPRHGKFALTCTDGSGCHSSASSVTSSEGLLIRRSSVRARRGPLRFLLPPCTFGVIGGRISSLLEPVFGPIGREAVGEPVQRPLQRPGGQQPGAGTNRCRRSGRCWSARASSRPPQGTRSRRRRLQQRRVLRQHRRPRSPATGIQDQPLTGQTPCPMARHRPSGHPPPPTSIATVPGRGREVLSVARYGNR